MSSDLVSAAYWTLTCIPYSPFVLEVHELLVCIVLRWLVSQSAVRQALWFVNEIG
jgi:hypothetical protein